MRFQVPVVIVVDVDGSTTTMQTLNAPDSAQVAGELQDVLNDVLDQYGPGSVGRSEYGRTWTVDSIEACASDPDDPNSPPVPAEPV